jgi:hypothetical protein
MSLKESISSKKFWFSIFALLLGFFFTILAATKLSELKSMFDTFVNLIQFIVASYLTGNVANKFFVARATQSTKDPKPKK